MAVKFKKRPGVLMHDLETQLAPRDIQDEHIPDDFKDFLELVGPSKGIYGLWPYQVKIFSVLFQAWNSRDTIDPTAKGAKLPDVIVKQCRQSGKTVPTGLWLAFMIIVLRCQVVMVAPKTSKTKKIARYVISVMRMAGEPMPADGIGEARFSDEAGFVCLSGQVEAERESDTAHIVLVDEAQDVAHHPVYGDLSPMRSGTTGIVVALGIGGVAESFIEKQWDGRGNLRVEVAWPEVVAQRPHYNLTVETDRAEMLPWEFRAHYEVARITNNSALLFEHIIDWEDAFPGREFILDHTINKDAAGWQLDVGIDWGRKYDTSVGIAKAYLPKEDIHVLYGFDMYQQLGWTHQSLGLRDWLKEVPFDMVRPETNNVGDPMEEILYKDLEAAKIVNPSSYAPVFSTAEEKMKALREVAILSMKRKIYWVRAKQYDPKGCGPRIIADLKGVTISHDLRDKMKPSHSDALSAMLTMFHPIPTGYIYVPRHRAA